MLRVWTPCLIQNLQVTVVRFWAPSMIRNRRLWGPLGLQHCPALCGSHHPVKVGEELLWDEDPQWFKHSLDSRREPIASDAASLEIRRSNLTSYKCLILPMISWQKHTEVSYFKVGNVSLLLLPFMASTTLKCWNAIMTTQLIRLWTGEQALWWIRTLL